MSSILISPAAVTALQAFTAAVEAASSATPWNSDELLPHTRGLADHLAADSTGWIPNHLVANALRRFEMLPADHEARVAANPLWQAAKDAFAAKVDDVTAPASPAAPAVPAASPAAPAAAAPVAAAPAAPSPAAPPKPPGA